MKKITTLLMLALMTTFGWQANSQNGGDTCAIAVVAAPGIYSDAAIVPGTGGATQAGATDALWYSYTPAVDGLMSINSCASDPVGIDTRLYVYTDGCDTLTLVASDDDGCDAPTTFGSLLADVAVVGQQEYLIQWDDRWGADAFDWELTGPDAYVPPTGLNCGEAFTAVPGVYNDAAITPGSGSATQAGATDALWYSYTAEGDGTIGINSCASDPAGIDTRLYVYTDGCDTLTPVANDDDGCDAPSTFGSLLADVAVVDGQEYLIQWDDRWGADAFDWELTFTPAPLDPTELPITLENQLPGFGDFNGSFTQAIANPDASGANTSATVAENTVPANAAFAGVNFGLDANIDITTQKGFTMTVWSPVANTPVLLKLENATTGVNAERAATTTTTGAWETVSFDFSAEGDLTFESVTLFMNFNVLDPATQTYYWDNLEQVDVVITGGAQIVEIDADQTGTDDQEFVEIKTEFANQSLNGMIAVFYNGSSDTSYRTVDLTGFASDDNGYFLLGSDAVAGADITMGADNTIQNGADAVALHTADAANFPDGTPATTDGLVDAVVYGTSDADDTGLLTGLGQTTQWDENENGAKDTESLQFDAATGTFCAQVPTPRAANILCGPPAPPVELPITLEDGQLPGFGDFNGSFTQAIANPDATGENTSATVAENTVPANAGFAGVNFALDTNIDITTDKFFTMAVWSQVPNMPVLLKLENASGANAEVAVNTTTTGAWETITFDFSEVGQLTYESVTLFMNFAATDPATQVYYWDNLAQTGEPVGDDGINCAVAIPVTPGVYNDAAITVGSGGAAQDDAADALWYVYTAEGDGSININSCFSVPEGIDTRLNVYTDGCDTLTPVANDDDGCDAPTTFGSILTEIEVNAGQEYLIEWDDRWGADAFDWELTFTPGSTITLPITYEDGQLPVFGDFNGSFTQVIANPDATGVNTSANVAENTVPPNAAFAGVNFGLDINIDITVEKGFSMDVWSPLADMPVLLKLENATTGVNAEIAATTTTTSAWETISFDFSEFGDLTFESVTVFMNFNQTDEASQTYYWDNLVQSPVSPENDLCDNAIELECGTTVTGDTTLATLEGAPEEVCDTALNTAPGVWYTLTFPAGSDYNVSVDTFESLFDTKLGVFTGACDALVCVGGNDDAVNDAGENVLQSKLEFVALGGETYSVYVTGFGTNVGLFNLTTSCETLGLDDNTIEGFTFYPNPSSDVINLNATENIERVTIYNMLGQKVLDQNINATSSQLDVANLVTGTYLMEVYAGGKTASHKVIKK